MSDVIEMQLDAIFAARNREDMQPTIDALIPIYNEHPENPRVLYELGGAYDTLGDEATALGFYEQAMEKRTCWRRTTPLLPPVRQHPPESRPDR